MNKIFDRDIKSERLLLRRITLNDIDDIFEYTSDRECTEHLSWESHTKRNQAENFVKTTLNEYKESFTRFSWGIELIDENKLIGVLSFFDIRLLSLNAEVSYILNLKYQGKGFMREALMHSIEFLFKDKDFVRIQAKCTMDNLSSEKLMVNVGMTKEGVLRKFWNIKGKYKNVLIYSIINDEI